MIESGGLTVASAERSVTVPVGGEAMSSVEVTIL